MRLTRVFTVIWIIGCGIIIIIITRNPVPPPPPDWRLVFGIVSIVFGVGGLIAEAIAGNRSRLSTQR